MLQNRLKTILPENWRDQFRHYESFPEDYYDVAEIELDSGEKRILVLNRNTDDLMEYYYDDIPDDQWIDLGKFLKTRNKFKSINTTGKHFINKKYEILCSKTGIIKKLSSNIISRTDYPSKNFSIDYFRSFIYSHLIIANIFVPNINPDNFTIVNHIDCNKSNFKKENLEWCTLSHNAKPENTKRIDRVNTTYKLIDKNENVIKTWIGCKEIIKEVPNYKIIIDKKLLYKDCYIVKENNANLVLEDYKSRHPVIENGWYTNSFITTHKVEANLCGILRVNGKETIGHLIKDRLKYTINIKGKIYPIHRLVYETISGKKIEPGNVIDHIQPVRSIETINNEYSNLRETTISGNMNNLETLRLFGKPCIKYDLCGNYIDKYDSLIEAAKTLDIVDLSIDSISTNISRAIINSCRSYHNFIWISKIDDYNLVENIVNYIYYKIDSDGNIINASRYFNEVITKDLYKFEKTKSKVHHKIRNIKQKYLNTGMPAPDGYYYQQGDPKNMLYDPDNTSYIKKREEIKWKSGK